MLKAVSSAERRDKSTIVSMVLLLLQSALTRNAARTKPGGNLCHISRRKLYLKNKPVAKKKKVRRHIDWGRILFLSFLMVTAIAGSMMPVFAATVWEKATEIMKDVYNQIVLISTVAAIVTASIALLLMNFSKSGRTVDESRSWLKRIAITWAVINGLGFIMAYITPFFTGGQWSSP